ncbi:MAG: hypothetical protein ACRBEQ_07670 [Hyphomonas sp.]
MTAKAISQHSGAAPSWKVAALVAFALALGLLAWRGTFLFMPAEQNISALSASEAALFNMIEPIVGAANVRVAVTPLQDGARVVTVLLNESVGAEMSQVRELAARTLSIEPSRGDALSVETAAFSAGAGGTATFAEYIELCGLVLLAGLTGWIGLRPYTAASSAVATAPTLSSADISRSPELIVPTPQPTIAKVDPLASVAKSDPARAADVLRGWMTPKEAS